MLINAIIPSTDPGSALFFLLVNVFYRGQNELLLGGGGGRRGGEEGPYQYL